MDDLTEIALETDTGIVLAVSLVEMLREIAILLPRLNVIEDICAEAQTRANRRIYRTLTGGLSSIHRER